MASGSGGSRQSDSSDTCTCAATQFGWPQCVDAADARARDFDRDDFEWDPDTRTVRSIVCSDGDGWSDDAAGAAAATGTHLSNAVPSVPLTVRSPKNSKETSAATVA